MNNSTQRMQRGRHRTSSVVIMTRMMGLVLKLLLLFSLVHCHKASPCTPGSKNIGNNTILIPRNIDANVLSGFNLRIGSGSAESMCVAHMQKHTDYMVKIACSGHQRATNTVKYQLSKYEGQFYLDVSNVTHEDNGRFIFWSNNPEKGLLADSEIYVTDNNSPTIKIYGRDGRRSSFHYPMTSENAVDISFTKLEHKLLFTLPPCDVHFPREVEVTLCEGIVSILFMRVSCSTAGQYRLMEAITRGNHVSTNITMLVADTIKVETFITKQPKGGSSDGEIVCVASKQVNRLEWYNGKLLIKEGGIYSLHRSYQTHLTLTVKNVMAYTRGPFSCRAETQCDYYVSKEVVFQELQYSTDQTTTDTLTNTRQEIESTTNVDFSSTINSINVENDSGCASGPLALFNPLSILSLLVLVAENVFIILIIVLRERKRERVKETS